MASAVWKRTCNREERPNAPAITRESRFGEHPAVRTGAHAILTENVKHFPAESVEPYNIDVLTADQFLAQQFHLNRELLEEKLCGQAKARGIPYEAIVQRLAKWALSVPKLLQESVKLREV